MRAPLALVLTLATLLGACRKQQGVETGSSVPAGKPAQTDSGAPPGVAPGIAPQAEIGAKTNPYTGDTHAIAVGRQLFTGFNCAGCHSGYAGGGMGPNLRDSVWVYGGSDVQLFSTITEGRPNGMPAWGGKIPPQQIWQIIAYLRTLGTPKEPAMPPTPSEGG